MKVRVYLAEQNQCLFTKPFILAVQDEGKLGVHSSFISYLSGNPLHCNCLLRPISYWLASVGRSKGRAGPWERAKCKSPQYYEGFAVDTLIEEQLICDKTEEAAKFKVNPDIQFRDIKK